MSTQPELHEILAVLGMKLSEIRQPLIRMTVLEHDGEHSQIRRPVYSQAFIAQLFMLTIPRYLRLSIRAGLAEDPNFHWCIGPQCESGQIHDPSGGDIFSCAACGYRSCSKCERPWHHEETCAQYTTRLDAVDGNEAASAAFIASNTKECPSCTSKIQKDGGCDHMTCKSLSHAGLALTASYSWQSQNEYCQDLASPHPILRC